MWIQGDLDGEFAFFRHEIGGVELFESCLLSSLISIFDESESLGASISALNDVGTDGRGLLEDLSEFIVIQGVGDVSDEESGDRGGSIAGIAWGTSSSFRVRWALWITRVWGGWRGGGVSVGISSGGGSGIS